MASKVDLWARAYRRGAKADGYRQMAAWLEKEGYMDAGEAAPQAVDDTVYLVKLLVYPGDKKGLLPLQVYDAAETRARYVLTFQGGQHQHVRLYCDDLPNQVNLVEIHDEGVGFQIMTIELAKPGKFSPGERARLEEQVRMDFFDDYAPGEIKLDFVSRSTRFLQVEISDD